MKDRESKLNKLRHQRYFCGSVFSLVILTVLALTNSVKAAAPTVVIASSPGINTASALAYYGTPSSPAVALVRDPLIREAARSLNYDIDQIYEFVRDNTETLPMFGLLKGSRGVLIDSYGTSFDQAQFMVDMLRESDAVTAKGYSPKYVLGQVNFTSQQFTDWTGISDAAVATKYLANAGVPATVTGTGTSFSISMVHIWISANIGGTTYLFDPSYKAYTVQTPINWSSSTAYSRTSLLSAGGGVQTAASVSAFNIPNFQNSLQTYRANLENFINANAAGKRAEAVVGTTRIVAHAATENRRTSINYITSSDQTWAGEIPDIFKTSFTVAVNGSPFGTYFSDAVGGTALGFDYALSGTTFVKSGAGTGTSISALVTNQCDDYLGSKPAATAVASVSINHPYAANAGTYGDRTLSRTVARQQCASGRFYVSNDWGYVGSGISSRLAPIASSIRYDPAGNNLFVFGPTIAKIASQYTALLDLAGKAQPSFFQQHDLIGIHTTEIVNSKLTTGGLSQFDQATNLSMSFEAAVSAFSKGNTTTGDLSAAYVAGFGLAIVEGSVPRQEADVVYDMSALSLLTQQDTRAVTPGTFPNYFATPSTWTATKSSLVSYPTTAVSAMDGYVLSEGYSILLPSRGLLRQPKITVAVSGSTTNRVSALWEGFNLNGDGGELTRSAFFAFHPSSGAGSVPDRIAIGIYDKRRGSVIKAGIGVPTATGANKDPIRKPEAPKTEGKDFIRAALNVDGRTGALTYSPPPDLVDGSGDFPDSLELRRVFDSRDKSNNGFGWGWKSNWHQVVTLSNDGDAALGRSGAQGVASALVMLQAIGDLVQTQDAKGLYAAEQVASWFTDTTINNTAVVSNGLSGETTFYRGASGAYINGRPDGSTLGITANATTGIINRRLYLGTTATFTDAAGTVRSYASAGNGVGYDLSSPGIAGLFTRKSQYMKTWAFPNGIKITADYDTSVATPDIFHLIRVYNNVGSAIYRSFYDFGQGIFEEPVCATPGGVVTYNPPRPAEIRYRSASREVRFLMDGQNAWTFSGDPDGARCAAGSTTPSRTRQALLSGLNTFVDAAGANWSYLYGGSYSSAQNGLFGTTGGLASIYKPTSGSTPSAAIIYGYDGNARGITNVFNNSWQYRSSLFRAEQTPPVQSTAVIPGIVTYFDRYAQPVKSVDPLQRTTTTAYDDRGQIVLTTRPEGDATARLYDVRGNVITETQMAKPSSGLANLVNSTNYVMGATIAVCANLVTCNKPSFSIDQRGFRTNYAWDSTTGEPLSVSSGYDAATGTICQIAGGTCATTTFTYTTSLLGYDIFSGTTLGTLSLPATKVLTIGAGNTTTTLYNTILKDFSPDQYVGMSINPVKKVVVNGIVGDSGGLNLRTCFAYDNAGNMISSTEPNAGLATCP